MFIAAIWGLSIDSEIEIAKGVTLIPFDRLADSFMKRRIVERATKGWNEAVWSSQRHFDMAASAIVRKVNDFPYIGSLGQSVSKLAEMETDTKAPLYFLQACAAGKPLVAGSWFEYEDDSLDLNSHENYAAWFLPEIIPLVQSHVGVDAVAIQRDAEAFWRLPDDWRKKLLRSMERFVLSQCRHQVGDRALDLAIAFEIAVSGSESENVPLSWKVAVRSAQSIGGTLQQRQQNRQSLVNLYYIRNKTAHGSGGNESKQQKKEEVFAAGTSVYRALLASFLSVTTPPDWPSLELEPRVCVSSATGNGR